MKKDSTCPDCGVLAGNAHLYGCDVERCPMCGQQLISCGCEFDELSPILWSGIWPGVDECQEFNWYAKFIQGSGWVRCDATDKEASPDINRLDIDAVWNIEKGRFILKNQSSEGA